MKPYPSYKNSGVEWIGEIPSHWDKVKTNLISENLDGRRIPLNSEQRGKMEGNIPYWGSNGIVDHINDYIFNEELVLVGEDGSPFFDKFKDVSFFVDGKVWVNNHIHILKSKPNILPKYLSHSFNCVDYKEYITGSTRDKLTQSDLSRIPHLIPPLAEQTQIVSFLDYKTQKIDELIDKTEKKIELLKEKRTALINHCVTKGLPTVERAKAGLNPNVEMKDSGVPARAEQREAGGEWIGEIPSGWKVKRLKYFSFLVTEKEKTKESDIKISPENVESYTGKCLNIYSEYTGTGVPFQSGDILLNKLRLYLVKILLPDYDGFSMGEMVVIRVNKDVSNRYYFYLLFNQGLIDLLDSQSTGIKVPRVSPEIIMGSYLPFPPISEQHQIVEYLDEQTQKIDTTIEKETQRIELLKEYRQSLISEVVTGKIDLSADRQV